MLRDHAFTNELFIYTSGPGETLNNRDWEQMTQCVRIENTFGEIEAQSDTVAIAMYIVRWQKSTIGKRALMHMMQ